MGKIELDHTGSGSGITLSSDGTDLLLNGTAIGGGGGAALDLYAENPSSPIAPSATGTNAVAIGSESVSAGLRSISLGDSYASGNDSFAAAIADNTSTFGATGTNSIAIGMQSKTPGYRSVSIGPRTNSSGSYAYTLGYYATASGFYSYSLGPFSTSSGEGAYAIGGSISATGKYSVAMGRRSKTTNRAQLAFTGEWFSAQGDSQTSIYVLRADTTDTTATTMVSGLTTASVSSDNQIILPNNSAYAFHGTLVARQQASAGTASAAWRIEGLIRREGSAGTTVLVNSATTVIDNTPSWAIALSADTTNGGLTITVTGAAATNIRWVATIYTSEVTY